MQYGELKEGIKYFHDRWPPHQGNVEEKYAALRLRGDDYWLHLEKMDPDRRMEEIIDNFLNTKAWNVHIPAKEPKRSKVKNGLEKAVKQLPQYYTDLQRNRIEDVDLKDSSIRSVINSIYCTFLQIEPKFGRVAASKLMHMALPDLFVMWDSSIIQRHCIPRERLTHIKGKARSYVGFLVLMQENILHVIKSYPEESQLTSQEVVQRIRAENNNLSLPRLLDMANMAVRDCEQAICISCMKKAKLRWAEFGLVTIDDSSDDESSD